MLKSDLTAFSDGQRDVAPLLQEILDQCGEIHIPGGTYLLGNTLEVHSDTALVADPDCLFRFADGAGRHSRNFMISNANPGNGNRNITISGGTWDANAARNPRGGDVPKNSFVLKHDPYPYSGVAINFTNVQNLILRNLTVCNPSSFFIRIGEISGFQIENIQLRSEIILPNQDGIHIGGFSEHGIIRNIQAYGKGVPNDDMIALNANDDVERQINLGMRQGPIRDIRIENVEAEDAYTFIRLLSVDQPIEDIHVRNMRGACRMHGINLNNWRFPRGVGRISRVVFEDMFLAKTQYTPSCTALITIALDIDELSIRNLQRTPETLPEIQTLNIINQQNLKLQLNGELHQVHADTGFVMPEGDIADLSIQKKPQPERKNLR